MSLAPGVFGAYEILSLLGSGGMGNVSRAREYARDSFRADKPQEVVTTPIMVRPHQRSYAVDPDGKRFVIAAVPQETATAQNNVVFVFNFFDELRRIAPPNGPND